MDDIQPEKLAGMRKVAEVMIDQHWTFMLSNARNEQDVLVAQADFRKQAEEMANTAFKGYELHFLNEIEDARGRIDDEYHRNAAALKTRLGVVQQRRPSGNRGLGTIVATEVTRTTVRVTLWESIRRLLFGR